MAKLALINREEKRAKLVAKYAKKRQELVAIIDNESLSDTERFEARQREPDPSAQPLPDHRPSAWRLPQVWPVPQQAPRTCVPRRSSGHGQGELVSRR
jgi:hypothetical protein